MTATQPDLDQRLATVERKVAKHDEDNRLYSEMITDTNIRVRGMESQLVQLDGRVDRLDGRIVKLDGRVDRLDSRLVQIDFRMHRIEDQMIQTDGRLVRIEDSLGLIAQALGVELPAAKPLDS
jgi:predicted  nucleic acid-binding Zn-ribbon protein